MRLEARAEVSRTIADRGAVRRGRGHARRLLAAGRVGRRSRRRRLPAPARRRGRLGLRRIGDADARDTADPHRARRRGRLPRASSTTSAREGQLYVGALAAVAVAQCAAVAAARRHVPADDGCGDGRRSAAAARTRVAQDAVRRRRGRDDAAAQFHRAAVRVDAARRSDEGSGRAGLAAVRRDPRRARAATARGALARALGTSHRARARRSRLGRSDASRRSASRCAPSGPTRAPRRSPACRCAPSWSRPPSCRARWPGSRDASRSRGAPVT